MPTPKIGLYGGTFSPPHNGHIEAAKTFKREMKLDELIVMPTGYLPHREKHATLSPAHRLAMAQLAFGGLHGVTVSDYEINKAEPAYTADTLRFLKDKGTLFLLIGDDMLPSLPNWHRADDIFTLAKIVVAPRTPSEALQALLEIYTARYHTDFFLLDKPILPLSSETLRQEIAMGNAVTASIPASVEDYIHAHKLYR